MARHQYRRWGIASVAAAAAVVIGATVWGLGTGTDRAEANGTDGQFCTPAQVTATMPFGDRRGSVAHDGVVVTARPGEGCFLNGAPPATLQGSSALRVESAPGYGPRVEVTSDHPVYIPLSWPKEGSAGAQATPRSITLSLPGTGELVVPWGGGGVDILDGSDPVRVDAARPGPVPAAFSG